MTDLDKIAEGREAEIFAWPDGSVLRLMRSPDAQQAVASQAIAMKAARAAGIDVPEVRGTETVDGRPGLIMERIDGPDMLTLIGKKPWLIFPGARIFGRLHTQMHETEAPADLPNLRERMRRRIEGSTRVPKYLAQFACSQLETLPDADRLCHGDFHPANIIWNDDQQAIIDWTGVARGDPAADYARTTLMLRSGRPAAGLSAAAAPAGAGGPRPADQPVRARVSQEPHPGRCAGGTLGGAGDGEPAGGWYRRGAGEDTEAARRAAGSLITIVGGDSPTAATA